MMNVVEKKGDAAVKRGAAQNITSVCYICGRRYAADGELCPDCAKIISTSLKLLRGA